MKLSNTTDLTFATFRQGRNLAYMNMHMNICYVSYREPCVADDGSDSEDCDDDTNNGNDNEDKDNNVNIV